MALTILNNLASLNTKRHLEESSDKFAQAAERLSTGRRINKSGDDAAGLSISTTIEGQVRSIQQAKRNAQDALSLMQVAEGGMNDINNLVIRLRELAIQAASDNIGDSERNMVQFEVDQLKQEIDRLSESTRFFDTSLLNGQGRNFVFQIGPDNNENNRLEYDASKLDLSLSALGLSGVDVSSISSARSSLESIDESMAAITEPRAQLGALQTRLNSISTSLSVYEENMTAAKSRIVDADIAKESAELVKAQVLQKAGVAVLAQANMAPALALKLLGD
ncbi:MAG: flagellin FliC [Deltaproteobacteria bacterium]|nr:flagellin FliC [Deltaproteobacteria bacterium]